MPAADTPIVAARRRRLREWILEKHGGSRKEFVEAAATRGHKLNPTEVSNLQTGNKSFGENKAAEYEAAAGMPPGYLIAAIQPASQSVQLDAAKLTDLIEAVDLAVARSRKRVSARKKAQVVVAVYQDDEAWAAGQAAWQALVAKHLATPEIV